jgi:hypothetical protein
MPNRAGSIAGQTERSNVIALRKTTMLIKAKTKRLTHGDRSQTTARQSVNNHVTNIPRPCSRFSHRKHVFLGRFLSCICECDPDGIRNVRNPVHDAKFVRCFKDGKEVLGVGHFHLKEPRLVVCDSEHIELFPELVVASFQIPVEPSTDREHNGETRERQYCQRPATPSHLIIPVYSRDTAQHLSTHLDCRQTGGSEESRSAELETWGYTLAESLS